VTTADFDRYRDRLDDAEQLRLIATGAESAAIRERARHLAERAGTANKGLGE
jgi:hypothetical protein